MVCQTALEARVVKVLIASCPAAFYCSDTAAVGVRGSNTVGLHQQERAVQKNLISPPSSNMLRHKMYHLLLVIRAGPMSGESRLRRHSTLVFKAEVASLSKAVLLYVRSSDMKHSVEVLPDNYAL